jgi:hypothetical protein
MIERVQIRGNFCRKRMSSAILRFYALFKAIVKWDLVRVASVQSVTALIEAILLASLIRASSPKPAPIPRVMIF